MWKFVFLALAGVVGYSVYKNDDENTDNEDTTFGISKKNLPKKIRIVDDMKSAKKDKSWTNGAMPDKYRSYQKLKNDKWISVRHQEFEDYLFWEDSKNPNVYYKKTSGRRNPIVYELKK